MEKNFEREIMGLTQPANGHFGVSASSSGFQAPTNFNFASVKGTSGMGTFAIIILTLSYYAAYFGYSIASQVISIGGIFQNPALLALNYLNFEDYEKYNMTNYATAFVLFYTGALSIASVVKIASMITILQIYFTGAYDQKRIFLRMSQVVGGIWLPEFLYYVLPTIATSGYMLSMTL
jgi:hypothetical protein